MTLPPTSTSPDPPPQESPPGRGRPRGSRRRWRYKLGRLLTDLLVLLGFRRMEVIGSFRYPKEALRKPRDERDRGGSLNWAASRSFALGAGIFCVTSALALLVYGLLPHSRPVGSQRVAAVLAVEAMASFEGGDKRGAAAVAEMIGRVKPPGHAAAYWGAYLKTAGPDLAAKAGAQAPGRLSRVDELVAQAGEQRGKGNLAGCVEGLGKAVARAPRDEALRLLRAAALMTAGRPADALADGDQLAKRGYVVAAADVRSKAYLALGQFPQAIEELKRGLAAMPGSTQLRLSLADLYVRSGQPKQALEEARTILAFERGNVSARTIAASAMEVSGDYAAAEAMLRRAIAIAPRDSLALNNLAWLVAEHSHRPQEALTYAQRAYQSAPRQAGVMDTLAWIHHRLGHDDVALKLLLGANALKPPDPDVRLHLGELLRLTGKEREGVAVLRELASGSVATAQREKARRELLAGRS